jgi:hypothetical protein
MFSLQSILILTFITFRLSLSQANSNILVLSDTSLLTNLPSMTAGFYTNAAVAVPQLRHLIHHNFSLGFVPCKPNNISCSCSNSSEAEELLNRKDWFNSSFCSYNWIILSHSTMISLLDTVTNQYYTTSIINIISCIQSQCPHSKVTLLAHFPPAAEERQLLITPHGSFTVPQLGMYYNDSVVMQVIPFYMKIQRELQSSNNCSIEILPLAQVLHSIFLSDHEVFRSFTEQPSVINTYLTAAIIFAVATKLWPRALDNSNLSTEMQLTLLAAIAKELQLNTRKIESSSSSSTAAVSNTLIPLHPLRLNVLSVYWTLFALYCCSALAYLLYWHAAALVCAAGVAVNKGYDADDIAAYEKESGWE